MENQINEPIKQPIEQEMQTAPKKKSKKFAIFLIVGPIVGLVSVLIAWSVLQVIFASMTNNGSAESLTGLVSIINFALSLLGIIFVIGIMFGIPIGIIMLLTREAKK